MASNNDAFLHSLSNIYQQLPSNLAVSFRSKDCCIQCFPHVINTCVKHTIKALNNGVNADTQVDVRDGRVKGDEGSDADEVAMMAPTLLLLLRINLLVISSTRCEGLFEKYTPWDKDLNVLPILLKVGTSMAGGKMHKELLSPFSPSNCFKMLRHGGTALIKCWFIFGNFVKFAFISDSLSVTC
jgi:hypothetical protein